MDIALIIIKIIKGVTVSALEKSYFVSWINESEENKLMFRRLQLMQKEGKDISDTSILDVDLAWKKVLGKSIKKKKIKMIPSWNLFYKYAAVLAGIAFFSYVYWQGKFNEVNTNEIKDSITLQLENGEVMVISSNDQQIITNNEGGVLGIQKGNYIDYSETPKTEKMAFNTLHVPYGEKFTLVLSDKTKVYLNAGSTLKYPVRFLEGRNRQVSLIGEGYFEVQEDKKHPFIVNSGDMDVRVLGTKFNVSAYPEDPNVTTVLLEGSVSLYSSQEIYNTNTATLLKPSYKAEWIKETNKVGLEEVDVDIYTGWIDGKLVLDKVLFKNIIKKLQRKYVVKIENKYHELDNKVLTAKFDIETIEDVLKSFQEETSFEYKIEGDHITILPPKT